MARQINAARGPLPYLILGGAQASVGAAAIFARFALHGAGPIAIAAGRLSIAALVLLGAGAIWPAGPHLSRRAKALLFFAGLALAVHFATWIGSLEFVNVAVSTLLVTTTPIWTAAYDAIVLRRGLTPAALGAFGCGGIGVALVVGFDRTPPPHPGHEWLGILLALLGSVGIGVYFVVVREVRAALSTRAIVTHTYSWAALGLIVAAALAREPLPSHTDVAAWGGIVAMALISQLLGHTALNSSLRWFSPSSISFATLLEPVVAAILALLVFHEAIAPLAVVGGAVLLLSIGVVLREERAMGSPFLP